MLYDSRLDILILGTCTATSAVRMTISDNVEKHYLNGKLLCTKVHGFFKEFDTKEDNLKNHFSGRDLMQAQKILEQERRRRANMAFRKKTAQTQETVDELELKALKPSQPPIF